MYFLLTGCARYAYAVPLSYIVTSVTFINCSQSLQIIHPFPEIDPPLTQEQPQSTIN